MHQAILCVNTFSRTHAEEAAPTEHYVGSDMTNSLCLLQMWQMLHQVWQHQSPPGWTQIFCCFTPWAYIPGIYLFHKVVTGETMPLIKSILPEINKTNQHDLRTTWGFYRFKHFNTGSKHGCSLMTLIRVDCSYLKSHGYIIGLEIDNIYSIKHRKWHNTKYFVQNTLNNVFYFIKRLNKFFTI